MPIFVAPNATLAETTAARDLATYFGKITGERYDVRPEGARELPAAGVWVGATAFAQANGVDCAALAPEEWVLKSVGKRLIVAGGRPRGMYYAACHLLEDYLGVRWWNAVEETVPSRKMLDLPIVNVHKKPVIRYRDIYMLEEPEAGAFCARNRLNRNGDRGLPAEFGGALDYGPPYHVHTSYMYFPPEQYFAQHPEWFAEIGGKRVNANAQLCTTNPELRAAMLAKLKDYIAQSRAAAEKDGRPAPLVFDISQNDCGGFCECPNCKALAEREGSESGPFLDLVNYLADGIRDQYPDVSLDTLAYFQTQKVPKTIKARDNVIIRLCDTGSNFAKPVTDPENAPFRDHIIAWSQVAKHLRIWRYAVPYGPYAVLPFASAQVYGPDCRFYAEHNVEGVFTEHEFGIIGDMRDFKIWMQAKLMEDPYRDYNALLKDFTDGFYGPAGPAIREYLTALQQAQEKAHSFIGMGGAPLNYKHLDVPFLAKAEGIFDRAEKSVATDPVLLRRVRHARLSLDRATVVLYKNLARSDAADVVGRGLVPRPSPQAGYKPPPYTLDRDAIAAREKDTWFTQIDLRVPPGSRAAQKAEAEKEIAGLLAVRMSVPLPEQFRNVPKDSVTDYTPEDFRNWADQAKTVPDTATEVGATDRFEIPDAELDKYKLPMPWGLYDVPRKIFVGGASIKPEDIPDAGYHWFKLPPFSVGDGHYVYFFWSWNIQCDIAPKGAPTDKFDIWAHIKFEGPAFPHGEAGQKNAISVERIVVVKAGK